MYGDRKMYFMVIHVVGFQEICELIVEHVQIMFTVYPHFIQSYHAQYNDVTKLAHDPWKISEHEHIRGPFTNFLQTGWVMIIYNHNLL